MVWENLFVYVQYICVKLKPRRCPCAARTQQGLVRHHWPTSKRAESGCRKSIQDWWLWETSAVSRGGGVERGCRMGAVFWGQFWLGACDAHAQGRALVPIVQLLFIFACFFLCRILIYFFTPWSGTLERYEMTKRSFVFRPDSLCVRASGVWLGFQLHQHIQQSLGQSWRKTPRAFNLQTEINTFSAGST